MNHIGGRKFIVTMCCGIATTVLVWCGKIDPGVYSAVTIAIVGAYIAGNVWQKKVVQE